MHPYLSTVAWRVTEQLGLACMVCGVWCVQEERSRLLTEKVQKEVEAEEKKKKIEEARKQQEEEARKRREVTAPPRPLQGANARPSMGASQSCGRAWLLCAGPAASSYLMK